MYLSDGRLRRPALGGFAAPAGRLSVSLRRARSAPQLRRVAAALRLFQRRFVFSACYVQCHPAQRVAMKYK